ncbi:hypothetical protein [Nocardioides psychrotolerans]|uniref:Uncharacterized protein n=1 Tax=Nocardioides psychrotolerans TaxID=1005945 RepID=A0A1I3LKW9_9ACTN|nr:hypothetical protein [Nocardioides psychrotolerans]SFI85382.1 hypothetical protein SAMN05216561_11414 [Nocardioides psychrotolerans]
MSAPQWEVTAVLVQSDPWLRPPSDADRVLVEACGGTVNETVAGAA